MKKRQKPSRLQKAGLAVVFFTTVTPTFELPNCTGAVLDSNNGHCHNLYLDDVVASIANSTGDEVTIQKKIVRS